MFNSFYGLTSNPFDKQQFSENDCFRSNDFEQMTARLNFLKETRGIGVFTARPGMGKSYALRCFAKSLNPNMYHMEYICLSTVSVSEFYKQFCRVLGVNDKGGKTGMFQSIQEQIYYLYKEKRQPLLLAVDEAQYLNTGILKLHAVRHRIDRFLFHVNQRTSRRPKFHKTQKCYRQSRTTKNRRSRHLSNGSLVRCHGKSCC